MYDRPPLLAAAQHKNLTLLHGVEGHQVDDQVESHAARKAENRRLTEHAYAEAVVSQRENIALGSEVRLRINRQRFRLGLLHQVGALGLAVNGTTAGQHVTRDARLP